MGASGTPGGPGDAVGASHGAAVCPQGLPREPPRSTPATSKDKASSTEATEHLRQARRPSSSGLMAMSRASMEITSSKEKALFLEPCGGICPSRAGRAGDSSDEL